MGRERRIEGRRSREKMGGKKGKKRGIFYRVLLHLYVTEKR